MKSSTRIISIVLAIIMLLTAVPIVGICDSDASSEDTSLPSSYMIDSSYITPIRNQGSEGVCWAFGMTAALETELIQMGYDKATTILSPLYESYSMYDTNTYSGSGEEIVLITGKLGTVGSYSFESALMLLNGRGPLYEYVAPYSEIGNYTLSDDIAYSNILTVRGLEIYNPYTDADIIKQKLCEGHAGSFSFFATDDSVNCYMPRTESLVSNHAVCIVGYDDNYSKDNFSGSNGTPEGDGAWITKNSWGTNESKGFNGYTYVSYYSSIENAVFYTDVTVNDGTLDMYSYDNGYSVLSDKEYRGSVTMSNVFTCERDGYIDSAYFSLFDKTSPDQDYKVYVYKLSNGYSNPTDGKLIAVSEKQNTDGRTGSYNTYLSSTEQLKKGDKFSVCIEMTGEVCYVPIDTYESYDNNHVSYTVAEKGQSYICYNGKWTDVSADGKSNVRVRAFITTEPAYEATLNSTYYEKFTDALKDAKSGDVISLMKDVTCDPVVIDKDVTIRFRGYDLRVNDKNVPAITINNAKVEMNYGRIICSENCIAVNGGAFKADYMSFETYEYALVSNGSEITLTSVTYNGSNALSLTGGKAALNNCYLTAMDEIITTDGCKVTINGGDYSGPELYIGDAGNMNVKAGIFDYKLTGIIDSDSFQEQISGKRFSVQTREVRVEGHDEILTFQDAASLFAEDGFVITLMKDVYPQYAHSGLLKEDVSMTIDLNGHSITKTDAGAFFIEKYNGTVTLKNTSETRSSINVRNFCSDCQNGTVIVGDNIDIIASNSVYYDQAYCKMTISDKSDAYIITDGTDGRTTAYPYFDDKGNYYELLEIKVYGEAKSVKYICSGKTTSVKRDTSGLDYTVNGVCTDANGNVLSNWERLYSQGVRVVASSPVGFTMIMEAFTDSSGKITMRYSDVIGAFMKTTGETNSSGVFYIATESTGYVKETIAPEQIDAAVFVNDYAVSKIKDLTSNYQRGIIFLSNNGVDKILKADTVNSLFDKGFDVGIKSYAYQFVLKCGTGKLTGDTVLKVDKVGRSELTNKADEAIGTGIAYSVYAKVDGEKVKELPCLSEITLFRNHSADDRISMVNSDGSLSSIDIAKDDAKDTFTVKESCIVAVNPEDTSGTASNTIMIIAFAVAAVIAIVGMGVFLFRRP